MIELELTFLAKSLPANLKNCASKKIVDLYIEGGSIHSSLRIRKNGDQFELTRKVPVEAGDASKQTETTISLNKEEFESLADSKARRIEKTRYYFEHNDHTAEFDVFEGGLDGLVLIDFEFKTEEAKDSFVMPDFCLIDITQETFIAGGVLAGKKYHEIESELKRFEYKALSVTAI